MHGVQFFLYVYRFVIPLSIFVVCYGQIVAVIRRQARIASRNAHAQPNPTVGGSASQQQTKQANSTQRNVIKTMIMVTGGFVVCWTPLQTYLLYLYVGGTGQIDIVPYYVTPFKPKLDTFDLSSPATQFIVLAHLFTSFSPSSH